MLFNTFLPETHKILGFKYIRYHCTFRRVRDLWQCVTEGGSKMVENGGDVLYWRPQCEMQWSVCNLFHKLFDMLLRTRIAFNWENDFRFEVVLHDKKEKQPFVALTGFRISSGKSTSVAITFRNASWNASHIVTLF